VFLFDVASRHMTWLAQRQSVTAANIANADTPGYLARTAAPFSAVLDGAALPLTATSPQHFSMAASRLSARSDVSGGTWGSAHSGNNVSLESELMTASGTTRMMSIDAGLTRQFHRMLLSSVKV
jgi:flagellar basal-body rod protein FlgB